MKNGKSSVLSKTEESQGVLYGTVKCNIDVVDDKNNDNDCKPYIHHCYLRAEFFIPDKTTGKFFTPNIMLVLQQPFTTASNENHSFGPCF